FVSSIVTIPDKLPLINVHYLIKHLSLPQNVSYVGLLHLFHPGFLKYLYAPASVHQFFLCLFHSFFLSLFLIVVLLLIRRHSPINFIYYFFSTVNYITISIP